MARELEDEEPVRGSGMSTKGIGEGCWSRAL